MKRHVTFLLLPLSAIVLSACGSGAHLATGTVTDKHYSPGSTYMSSGVLQHNPPHWYLDLESCDSTGKNCQHGSRSVTEVQYNSVKVGDFYRG